MNLNSSLMEIQTYRRRVVNIRSSSLLPVVVSVKRMRIMKFFIIEIIKRIQAFDAQNNAQARQKAHGYNNTLISDNSSSFFC